MKMARPLRATARLDSARATQPRATLHDATSPHQARRCRHRPFQRTATRWGHQGSPDWRRGFGEEATVRTTSLTGTPSRDPPWPSALRMLHSNAPSVTWSPNQTLKCPWRQQRPKCHLITKSNTEISLTTGIKGLFVCMDVSFCLLCMHNMYMYICICMLSTVGTGVLTCSIVVLYLLCWIIKNQKIKGVFYYHHQQMEGKNEKAKCVAYSNTRPL